MWQAEFLEMAHEAGPPGAPAHAPLIERRADPRILRHADGYYYFTATVPQHDRIELRRAKTIEGLASAQMRNVWRRPAGIGHVLAPALLCHRGVWMIHFTAVSSAAPQDSHLYAVVNASLNPVEGEWEFAGRVDLGRGAPCAGASMFSHRRQLYCVSADAAGVWLRPMATPQRAAAVGVLLGGQGAGDAGVDAGDDAGAEAAPAVLAHGGRVVVVHPAVGLLWAADDADLLDGSAWQRAGGPAAWPGPGSLTVAEDGATVLRVHHAGTAPDQCHTFVAPLDWRRRCAGFGAAASGDSVA